MPDAAPSQPSADRNLLFGILALQMDFIGRDALIAGMNAWVLDKAKPLGQVLVEQGALTANAQDKLDAVVELHLELHGGDPQKSLAAVSSIGSLRQELQQVADAELHASLAQVSVARPEEDPWATRPPAVGQASVPGLRFRILHKHAEGGLGAVFVAHDEELHRHVALKKIKEHYADQPESRSRFLLEAEVTGGLEHPGIVPVYGLGCYPDGRPFYAMRFIKGDSLRDAIQRFHAADAGKRDPGERSLAFRELLGRFVDACNALAYAHARGILHRDVKPHNIMLGKYGETLVVDWGLAKMIGHHEGMAGSEEGTLQPFSGGDKPPTQVGAVFGTPSYMSPEQAGGQLDQLGPASDIYSLGATLYELLTGTEPVHGQQVGEILAKVKLGNWLWPRQVKPGVPRALEAICLKAMALKPEGRYASPRALADDIEHWLADEPVSAWSEPWTVRRRRWLRRHRTVVGAVMAALGVALIGLTVGLVLLTAANERANKQRDEAERQRDTARLNLYVSDMIRALRGWEDADLGRVGELLDAHSPKRADEKDLRGWEWYYQERLLNTELRKLDPLVRANCVAFSPDGTRLATGGFALYLWDSATGQKLRMLKEHTPRPVFSVAFSPDGKLLASSDWDQKVELWDTATGQVRQGATKPQGRGGQIRGLQS